MSLTLASLKNLDTGATVAFMFNPNQYTITKSNNWSGGGSSGGSGTGSTKNSPEIVFGGGEAATLTMELFFDTWHRAKSPESADDVRIETDKIFKLMQKDESLKDAANEMGRPPFVLFLWGKTWSFEAAITSVTQKFTMFMGDGTPVRATLEVAFRQRKDKYELSSSTYKAGSGSVVTVPGNTTASALADKYLGNADHFGMILDANPRLITNTIKAGTEVAIPAIKDVKTIVSDAKTLFGKII